MSTPVSIFETSVFHNIGEDDQEILFSKNIVKSKLKKFYDYELSKFANKFSYEIYFYNKEDESMCVELNCNSVEISFSAFLIYGYHYQRVVHYEVFKTINEP